VIAVLDRNGLAFGIAEPPNFRVRVDEATDKGQQISEDDTSDHCPCSLCLDK